MKIKLAFEGCEDMVQAKSTWMPLGTKIICCIFIKHCSTMNYADVAKIDLFPVLQNYPLVQNNLTGHLTE